MTFTNNEYDDGLTIPPRPTAEASRRYQASRDAAEACQDARTARLALWADIAGFVGIVAGIALLSLLASQALALLS